MSIRYLSDAKVSDQYRIDVDPRVVVMGADINYTSSEIKSWTRDYIDINIGMLLLTHVHFNFNFGLV